VTAAHGTPLHPKSQCQECKRLRDGIVEATSTPFGWKAAGILKALLEPTKEKK
jgi:hypothetical protein